MIAPRRLVALLGACLVLGAIPAAGRAQTNPADAPPLSVTAPGTSTQATPPPPARTAPRSEHQSAGLPNTGSDPRVLALLGAGFLLTGIGLRLRTHDARY